MNFHSQSETLPVVNGILYRNERIQKYRIQTEPDSSRILIPGDVSDFGTGQDYADTTAYCNAILVREDIDTRFLAGEGSYGGDGFILAESLGTGEMLWLISFEDSNPFVKLSGKQHVLLAENNLGEIWAVDIHNWNAVTLSVIRQSKFR